LFFRYGKAEKQSDQELIERYKHKKDQRFVGVLFERYSHLVFGLCLKYLKDEEKSKDAVLQIFETLMQSLLDHEVKYFKSWLFSVSRNHCLMQLRSTASKQAKQEQIQEHVQFMSIDRSEELEEREMQLNELEGALEKLRPEQKECIQLFYLNGNSYQDVAESTGYTPNEVKSFLQNGKRNLRIIITQQHAKRS